MDENKPEIPPVNNDEEKNTKPTVKMVEKEKLDDALSRMAEMQKKLKAFEDKDKSDMQLKDEQLENTNKLVLELQGKLNIASINAEVADCKSKLELNDNEDFNNLITVMSHTSDDSDTVINNAKSLNKLLLDAYNKGVKDVENKNYNSLTKNIFNANGSNTNNTSESLGSKLAKINKDSNLEKIKNYYKKEK